MSTRTVTTEKEWDEMPVGTVLAALDSGAPADVEVYVRWPGGWRTDGLSRKIEDFSRVGPLVVLYDPENPRTEATIKAEALYELVDDILAEEAEYRERCEVYGYSVVTISPSYARWLWLRARALDDRAGPVLK